jgi:hypothetical protein
MKNLKFTGVQLGGIVCCLLLIVSPFLHWAWYPDLQKHFTGFFSENNSYGKPGKMLLTLGLLGLFCFVLNKTWTQRINLIAAALCMAYAIRNYLIFTSGYDGFVPEPRIGIFIMLFSAIGYVVLAAMAITVVKKQVPLENQQPAPTPSAESA